MVIQEKRIYQKIFAHKSNNQRNPSLETTRKLILLSTKRIPGIASNVPKSLEVGSLHQEIYHTRYHNLCESRDTTYTLWPMQAVILSVYSVSFGLEIWSTRRRSNALTGAGDQICFVRHLVPLDSEVFSHHLLEIRVLWLLQIHQHVWKSYYKDQTLVSAVCTFLRKILVVMMTSQHAIYLSHV